jgi:hypothetical protein
MWSLSVKMLICPHKWAAMVAGFEGDDVNSKYHVASMKHFIGYGSTTTGKTEPLVLYPNVF